MHQEVAVAHPGHFVYLGEELDLEALAEAFRIFEAVSLASFLGNDGHTDPFAAGSGHVDAFRDVALHVVDRVDRPDEGDIAVDADALANDVLEYVAVGVVVHASDARA